MHMDMQLLFSQISTELLFCVCVCVCERERSFTVQVTTIFLERDFLCFHRKTKYRLARKLGEKAMYTQYTQGGALGFWRGATVVLWDLI